MKTHTTFHTTAKTFLTLAAASLLSVAAFSAPPTPPITLRIELDRSVLPADTTDRAIVKVAIDGRRLPRAEARPPVNLCIVLDRSGSMQGEKLEQAKRAAIEALNHLGEGDIFSLVIFDDKIETLFPGTRIDKAGTRNVIESYIRQITARGSTALFGGLSQGAAEIRKYIENSGYSHRIILLSDGKANVGPDFAADFGRLGAALMKEGISVTTVGLGLGYDEDIMTRLALKSDGNTYFVEDARDLARIFDAELGDVLNIVARRAVVTIEFPEGVRPIRFVGREGSIRGQNAELTLNQIYGGQEKFALIEVETPRARAGTEREIARAQVVFEDALANKSASLDATSRARFSDDKSVVIKSGNSAVQTNYAENRFAEAKDKAVALADAGKTAEAAQAIQDEVVQMSAFSVSTGNAAVGKLATDNRADAAKIATEGIGNADRKNYRAQFNATVTQQSSSGTSSFISSGTK